MSLYDGAPSDIRNFFTFAGSLKYNKIEKELHFTTRTCCYSYSACFVGIHGPLQHQLPLVAFV